MELYQLKASTLELVTMLREAHTIGPHNYQRGNGKTTALMIHAKELLDTKVDFDLHQVVIYLSAQPTLYHDWYRQLMPKADKMPLFLKVLPRGYAEGSYILVDEPWSLKFGHDDWDYIGQRYQVLSVGQWYR